ncbi:hypothetical protein HFP57_02765 [Parasphingopyxis algicola]|uniref:DUF6628 family protein n=1 Tax=Parasphingopyxis algicola TaxID=2026624 RepID=UPI0015A4BB71|nr:DUF6628 family protein [Parasphingopyxis algicola]QLC24061.1 hypothetical protein HFP57_02765 [Parasphingopyxis algicola]
MPESSKLDTMLPHAAPVCGNARTLLFAIRRMAIHGLNDAFAANAMLAAYGMRYRKPLLLVRALLIDIARSARGHVIVAPCCAPRMTAHEHALLSAIGDPAGADTHIARLLDSGKTSTAVATATALNESLSAIGRPVAL